MRGLKLSSNLLENLEIGMIMRDGKGRLKEMNEAAKQILTGVIPNLESLDDNDVLPHFSINRIEKLRKKDYPPQEALSRDTIVKDRELFVHTDEEEGKWIRVTSIPVHNRFERITSVFSLFTDISEPKRIEEELNENRKLLRLVMDNIPQFIFWKDTQSIYSGCNGNFAQAAGVGDPENIKNKSDFDLPWTREEAEDFRRDDRAVMESGLPKYHIMEPQLQADGRTRWLETNKVPLKDEKGEIIGILGTFEDITERLELEEELKRVKNYLSEIINSMPSEIICADRECRVTLCNREAETRENRREKDSIGLPLLDVLQRFPRVESLVRDVLGSDQVHRERSSRTEEKHRLCEEISIFPLKDGMGETMGVVIRIDDISQTVKMQEQLIQSQKMDALGQMSGGMAHDFNNILGGIYGATELLLKDKNLAEDKLQLLSIIRESSERAKNVIEKLLTFSRSETEAYVPVNVHKVVSDTVTMLSTTLDKRVVIHTGLEAEDHTILGNASQLQTVLLNMAINAGHAMPGGGDLSLTTSQVYLDEKFCRNSSFDLAKGEYLLLKIEDTGTGIPPRILSRIFEPFFTTKEPGKGTGLGLSAAYGLVTQLNGAISVYSEVNRGTWFSLYLPLIPGEESTRQIMDVDLIKGAGTILIVDDENTLLTVTEALLMDMGFTVIKAENGAAALEIFRERKEEILLVITDMIMPRMNGTDLFFSIRDIEPEQPVVVSSGFSHEEEIDKLKNAGLNGFIRKPYNGAALSKLIDSILNDDKKG